MNDQGIPQVRHELERWLGARVTGELVDGVEFELNGVDGYARHKGGEFRASFFLALDPDPDLADAFVRRWSDIAGGLVELASFEEGQTLRFLVERPYSGEQRPYLYEPEVVRFLRARWHQAAGLAPMDGDTEAFGGMLHRPEQRVSDLLGAARVGLRLGQPVQLFWVQPLPLTMPDFGFPVVCDADGRLLWVPASRWTLIGDAVTEAQALTELAEQRHLRIHHRGPWGA